MLKQVLQMFEDTSQPISITQIAQQLNIEPAMVEDMIAFWVRKGKLKDLSECSTSCTTCSSGSVGGCHSTTVQMPRRYVRTEAAPKNQIGLIQIS